MVSDEPSAKLSVKSGARSPTALPTLTLATCGGAGVAVAVGGTGVDVGAGVGVGGTGVAVGAGVGV